ncbi:MAG: aminotransferase class V-fold PLP-dependent enzyme [Thermodesulfovibrionales bacterium]
MRPLEAYRSEFPIVENYIYLDHAGVAPISLRVKRAVEQYATEASMKAMFHYMDWMKKVHGVRKRCADLINSDSHEIAFVKNTSHGLSIVASGLDWKVGDNMLVYDKEFPSNIYPWMGLQRKGVEVRFIKSVKDSIRIEDIESLINQRTRLVSISSVQFVNGFKIDLKKVGNMCREKGVYLCVDAIQSLGVIPVDVKACNIDFLSADGHKWLLSPEGTGIFYCKKGLAERLDPPLIGWKSIKRDMEFESIDLELKDNALRFEEASMNVMGIYALGASLDMLFEIGIERIQEHVLGLGEIIIEEDDKRGFNVLTPRNKERRGGIVTFAGEFDPRDVKEKLEKMNIMVTVRGRGIRVSPHFYNTKDDILSLFEAIDDLLN